MNRSIRVSLVITLSVTILAALVTTAVESRNVPTRETRSVSPVEQEPLTVLFPEQPGKCLSIAVEVFKIHSARVLSGFKTCSHERCTYHLPRSSQYMAYQPKYEKLRVQLVYNNFTLIIVWSARPPE